jgi:phosphoribosylformylglycinamidine synthase
MRGQVVVRLKQEVLDPQGVTIAKALDNLGYEGVGSLRQGKVFDVELETSDPAVARTALEKMARDLLANPVIEDYEIHLLEDGPLNGEEGNG